MIPRRGGRLLAAELSLLGVSLVLVAGFARLFDTGGWFLPLAATALTAHLVGAGARRLGVGVWLQIAGVALATLLLMGWTQAPDTLRWFLPTADTLAAFGTALDEALTLYPEARAPTAPVVGFILASMIGLAIVSTMADIAAFRLGAELQALIPPLTLFLFCSLLGEGAHRVTVAVAFSVASLTFVLLMRALTTRTATTWLPGDDRRGPTALVKVGTSLTAVAVLGAVVLTPALPGAEEEGLWTWRGGSGTGTRFIVSPLVDIRSRLVNQSSEVAFVVESAEPSSWRMLSLDEFEGDQFRLSSSFRATGGSLSLPGTVDDPVIVTQRFTIEGLASPYLPAAFQPVGVDTGRQAVRWDDRSATLLLEADEPPRGFRYSVESALPNFEPERLRAAPDTVLPSIRERYLQLPDLDPQVAALAEAVVADGATPYDRALLLQNHLRSEYEYSLEVPAGHSESALARFLFVDRAGYCEQFSAAFAAMARHVGLPARVAVGFTVGERQRGSPTRFVVRGEHAHAWPEVWFNGVGWVPFEPTPGRGDPQTIGHTGVQPDQVGGVGEATSTTTSTTQPGDRPAPEFDPGMLPDFDMGTPGSGATGTSDRGSPLPGPVIGLLALLGVAVAWIAALRAAHVVVRHRRRHTGADHPRRVLVAWDELVTAAASLRVVPDTAETHREYLRRLSRSRGVPDFSSLATAASAARFGAVAPDDEALGALLVEFDDAIATVRDLRSRKARLVDLVDPRPLLGPPRPRAARRQTRISASTFEPA